MMQNVCINAKSNSSSQPRWQVSGSASSYQAPGIGVGGAGRGSGGIPQYEIKTIMIPRVIPSLSEGKNSKNNSGSGGSGKEIAQKSSGDNTASGGGGNNQKNSSGASIGSKSSLNTVPIKVVGSNRHASEDNNASFLSSSMHSSEKHNDPLLNNPLISQNNHGLQRRMAELRYQDCEIVMTTGNDDDLCINIETMSNRSNAPGQIREIPMSRAQQQLMIQQAITAGNQPPSASILSTIEKKPPSNQSRHSSGIADVPSSNSQPDDSEESKSTRYEKKGRKILYLYSKNQDPQVNSNESNGNITVQIQTGEEDQPQSILRRVTKTLKKLPKLKIVLHRPV